MKYCSKCGKELFDEAVMCPACGHTFENHAVQVATPKKPMSKKKIALIIASAVAVIALLIGGFFAWRFFKIEQVKKDLAGNAYVYRESSTYSYSEESFSFDEDAVCTYNFYMYGFFDADYEYERLYEFELKNGKVYLEFGATTLEVQYNDYGEIKQLCDIDTDEVYKKR